MSLSIDNMIQGWFVGDFTPSAFKTDKCEIAIKKYLEGDIEPLHKHINADEIVCVLQGKVQIQDIEFKPSEISYVKVNEPTNLIALEDSVCLFIKFKYLR